jgi:predicted phosphodiesterase
VKIGLFGDIHAEDERLAAALAHVKALGATLLVSVGDIADGRGDLERTCALLEDNQVLTVRGNHDRWLLADELRQLPHAPRREELSPRTLAFLEALPATRELDTPLGRALVCHGVGDNDMKQLRPEHDGYELANNDELHALLAARTYTLVLGGHTHARMLRTFTGADRHELTVINAGTFRAWDDPCFALVDFDRGVVDFFAASDAKKITLLESSPLPRAPASPG